MNGRNRTVVALLALVSLIVTATPARSAVVFEGTFGKPPNEDGTLAEDSLAYPYDIAVDPDTGEIYVVDNAAFRILKYDKDRKFVMSIGTPGTGEDHDDDGQLYYPQSIALDPSGAFLYVADTFNSRIQVFNTADGGFHRKWGTQGFGDDQLNYPGGIAIDSADNVYVADTRNHRVMKFTSSGTFIKKWGEFGSGDGQFNTPVGVDVDRIGGVLVTEDVGRVQLFDSDGGFIQSYGLGASGLVLSNPDEISILDKYTAYVIEAGGEGDGHEVSVFDTRSGKFLGEFAGSPHGSDYGFSPHGIGLNTETGELFVAAGGSAKKIWRYSTGVGNVELSVDRPDRFIRKGRFEFYVSHNMMIGSCRVKGTGVMRVQPRDDPFEEDEKFKLTGDSVLVDAKQLIVYRVPVSDKAAKAIQRTTSKVVIEFKATCVDELGDPETAEPVKVRFTLH